MNARALRIALTVAAVAAGAGYVAWRRPRAGGPCRQGADCDGGTALLCRDGRYLAEPCRGPQGCHSDGGEVVCDMSAGRDGDPCFDLGDRAASGQCAADGQALVICAGGKIAHEPCRGARGCEQKGRAARCDQSLARPGDPCQEGSACADDGRALLRCVDGKAVPAQSCRGKKGCAIAGDRIACDFEVADAGDPCMDEGTGACSQDRRAVLVCRRARYARDKPCAAPEHCASDGHDFRCVKK